MTCTSCQTHFCWLCGEKLAEEEITTHYDSASLFGCSGLQFAELKGGTLARMAGRGWVMRLHVWAIRAAMAQTTLLFVVAFVAQLPMLLPFNLLLAAAYATAAAARACGAARRLGYTSYASEPWLDRHEYFEVGCLDWSAQEPTMSAELARPRVKC